ncbi:leucine-rich repeat flightless-interacting protein 1 isoform X5 [Pogona vitticeps]
MELVGTQQQGAAGRKRVPNRERPTAEDDALNQIAREAEARLAAKRAARAEAREIRMKELERQQKEIYQVQKKYYGLDTKFGDIEQWMEDSERYTRKSRRNASASDEDERMSVGSRGSLRPSLLYSDAVPARSYRASLFDENFNSGNRRYSASSSRPPSEYSCYLGSGSRASSRASSARASPVVEERPEKDFEKGVRTVSSLSAATLASLGGTSSRRGSGDTSISVDTEASIREIKDINELKDQIQDVEGKYMQGLKEMKDSLAEVEEKYKKAMVSNAQLDNEKTNFMYQVDNLKDALLELEEQLAESRRQYEEKSKDFEREKHAHAILQFQFIEVKEALKQREELLAEIRQLQQKQESYVREMSDLQETIEWKEKKIGALERQKEFFDSIRGERDDLREEVVMLKEQLKQHGIIPKSEVAANGETAEDLDNGGLASSSKIVSGASHTPEVAGDGVLGRANEMEMKNEILENMGKSEILQNTEHEEHTEETKEQEVVQECSEIKPLHADENVEAEKITEGKVVSTLVLSSGLEEPAKNLSQHLPGIVCAIENSGAVEVRGEGGSLGDTREVKEFDGNGLNKIDHQNKEADVSTEVNLELNTGLEMLPKEQSKENQIDIVVDVADDNNSEEFQEALESVNSSCIANSSQSESPELMEDKLSRVPATNPSSEKSESKIVEDDLSSQLVNKEANITLSAKAEWNENEVGEINEQNDMEDAVHQQESWWTASDSEQSKHAPNEFVEEQKEIEKDKMQSLSSEHDVCVEEEQNEQKKGTTENNVEQSLAKGTNYTENLLGTLDAPLVSEGKVEQHTMEEGCAKESVVGDVTNSECHSYEEKKINVEDGPRKCRETKTDFIDDGKPLADVSGTPEKIADEGHEEYNTKHIKDWSAEEQSKARLDDNVSELDTTERMIEDTEEVGKGNEENKNHGQIEEKVLEVVPEIVEAACLESQKPEYINQEKESDSEEEVGEEYHEACDFSESPLEEQRTTAWSEKQGNKLETICHQTQEKDQVVESTAQNVLKENSEEECKNTERFTEENKEKFYQIPSDEMMDEAMLTENKNMQHGKGNKAEEAEHLLTDSFISEPSRAQCETLEDTNRDILYEISSKQIAEYTSEQLKELEASVHESQEEFQPGRKGKGKSREDCNIS